jgi:predicted nucleotidyltransferase
VDPESYGVFFFGSRVTGGGSERSDIDIGISGPNVVPAATIERIREDLNELPYLYMIDVVDLHTAPASFRKEALKKTESLYD